MRPEAVVPVAAVDIPPEDIEAVGAVLASGQLRQGDLVAEFEEAFASRVGARHAVAVSSGTAALHLTYLALFRPGDEVIVPAFTFVASASMLLAIGAVPVFAEIDPRTFTLAAEDVRQRITPRTRGIVGVHLFGNACDVDSLAKVAADSGVPLVWDAAQALGTEYRGKDVGSYPNVSCYSFYPTKNITTGEGGMVTTDDHDLAKALRLSRSQGAEEKYFHTVLGFNYRLTDFQAALGIRQLRRLDDYLTRRRTNAEILSAELSPLQGVIDVPATTADGRHSFNQYSVLVRPPLSRGEMIEKLDRMGVQTAVHYPRPLHRQPVMQAIAGDVVLETSERLCREILAVPVHPQLTQSDVERTASAITELANRASRRA